LVNDAQIPVIAGLIVGIVFVVLLALFFNSTSPISSYHADLSINGLKERYSRGETIDFIIRATGHGSSCGYPDARIIDLDREDVIFKLPEGFILIICDTATTIFDKSWTQQDLRLSEPIRIDKVGHYKITASFKEDTVEKYFIVDDAIKHSIDKITDLDSLQAFKQHYPDANATVYFVTTCATDSCETLVRIPSIVEYSQEIGGKIATLRISLEHKWDGKPTFFQLSCHIPSTEESTEIHGTISTQEDIEPFIVNSGHCPR
jgi:hypothetical protein